jgi:hypothetical protein
MRARDGAFLIHLIDDHLDGLADAAREQRRADGLLMLHQAGVTLGLHLLGDLAGKRVGAGAVHVLIFEAADA